MQVASLLNQFHIRLASSSDLAVICAIEDDSFSTPYPPSLLERLLKDCPEGFFVATTRAGKLVGYCVCSSDRNFAHLISIAVQTDYRKRGVATSLLQRTIEVLIEQKIPELWLEVNLKNVDAIRLYSKLGFEKMGVERRYYSDGSDAIRMRLMIREA